MARKKADSISMEEPNLYDAETVYGDADSVNGADAAAPAWGAEEEMFHAGAAETAAGDMAFEEQSAWFAEDAAEAEGTPGDSDAFGASEGEGPGEYEGNALTGNEELGATDEIFADGGELSESDMEPQAVQEDEDSEADDDRVFDELQSMNLNSTENDSFPILPDEEDFAESGIDAPEAGSAADRIKDDARTETVRRGHAPERGAVLRRPDRVLTIDAHDEIESEEEKEAALWHDIQNAYRTRRILTGMLDSIEPTPVGMVVAVVNYNGFRVAIPLKEMIVYPGRMPTGRAYRELVEETEKHMRARIGCEIDFVIRRIINSDRSIYASRKDAMLRKRRNFYFNTDESGSPMVYEGRIVQARVVAVSEKVLRVEVFGVDCSIHAPHVSSAWVEDARERFFVGERILVRVVEISGTTPETLSVKVDIRSITNTSRLDTLKHCVIGGRYAGKVTDVRKGVTFLVLNNRANAIAHTTHDPRKAGKRDDVIFVVTKLDKEQGVAIGEIIRIIRQNL